MKKRKLKKLQLNRETLLALDRENLTIVRAGTAVLTTRCTKTDYCGECGGSNSCTTDVN